MPFEPAEDPRAARRSTITRWVTLVLVAALVGLVVYLGYLGFIGSDQLANPPLPSTDCRTPAIADGWVYEAINYDASTDGVAGKSLKTSTTEVTEQKQRTQITNFSNSVSSVSVSSVVELL